MRGLLIGLPFVLMGATAMAADYRWEQVTMTAAFAPRDGAGALTFAGKMWLLGGWNPGDKVNFPRICNSEVWSSTDGHTWTEVNEQAPWEGRHTAGWVVAGNNMQPDVWKLVLK